MPTHSVKQLNSLQVPTVQCRWVQYTLCKSLFRRLRWLLGKQCSLKRYHVCCILIVLQRCSGALCAAAAAAAADVVQVRMGERVYLCSTGDGSILELSYPSMTLVRLCLWHEHHSLWAQPDNVLMADKAVPWKSSTSWCI
jgi:hypothetical protein